MAGVVMILSSFDPGSRRVSLNTQEVLALYDRDQRREIDFPGMRRDVLSSLVRFVRPMPGMSFVLYSELDDTTADAAIDEQLDYFGRLRSDFEWKAYSHDRPADLVARLVARGFVAEEPDAIMALDVAAAPDSLLTPPATDVRRLTHPDQLTDVVSVLEPVWQEDFKWVHGRLGAHMAIDGYLSVFVAYVTGVPACAGWTYYNADHFAGLWGGSTLPAYRGQGLYTALLAARVREARERGVPYLTIDAGAMSRPIVARHGFELLTTATACEKKYHRPHAPGG